MRDARFSDKILTSESSLLRRCLEWDPARRPDSFASILREINSFEHGNPELWSAKERCAFLAGLGDMVAGPGFFTGESAAFEHRQFVDRLRLGASLLPLVYNEAAWSTMWPKLAGESDEDWRLVADTVEGQLSNQLNRSKLHELLRAIRNLTVHANDSFRFRDLGFNKERFEYELGDRFSPLAVALAKDLREFERLPQGAPAHSIAKGLANIHD